MSPWVGMSLLLTGISGVVYNVGKYSHSQQGQTQGDRE